MTEHPMLRRLRAVLTRLRAERGQPGQTTVEVVGILVLVTAILVVVAAAVPTIHQTISHAMHSMLAVMFDGRVV